MKGDYKTAAEALAASEALASELGAGWIAAPWKDKGDHFCEARHTATASHCYRSDGDPRVSLLVPLERTAGLCAVSISADTPALALQVARQQLTDRIAALQRAASALTSDGAQ